MASGPEAVRTTAARMALLTQKPLNINGAYAQRTTYLVLLGPPPAPAAAEADLE